MFSLSEKVIACTGGAGVLGASISRSLVEAGAHVVILTRDAQRAEPLEAALADAPGSLTTLACDVTERPQLERARAAILQRWGRVDALINGAGGNHPQATTNPQQDFFGLPADALEQVMRLNWMGTLLPCQVFGESMAAARRGAILNIASMASLRPLTRIPGYSAAKAAVVSLTQWLAVHMAQEYSPQIRVNAIAPGFFLTAQNRFLLVDEEGQPTARGQSILDHTPMARYGAPEELRGVVHWLLSDASAFVTGIVVPVDGGFSAFSGV